MAQHGIESLSRRRAGGMLAENSGTAVAFPPPPPQTRVHHLFVETALTFNDGGRQVDILTDHLPCGREVWIDLEPDMPMHEVKRKLAAATGVPVGHQKVMLSGIGQLVMGDKR